MARTSDDQSGELLIREVEEDLRREYYLKLWRRYGGYLIAASVAIVLTVACYQGWRAWQGHIQRQDAQRFAAASEALANGKQDDALAILADLARNGRTGYTTAALMAEADVKARSGDRDGAIAAYDRLVNSTAPALYRDLAVMKRALLVLNDGDLGEGEKRVADIAVAGNPWRHTAMEILAANALKKGSAARATELYRQISNDAQAPQGMRARATEMLATSALSAPPGAATVTDDKVKGQ